MTADRPIVFLAFADARRDLPALRVEGWSLKDQFDKLKERKVIADVVVEEFASLDRIYSVFLRYRDRIRVLPLRGSRRRGPPALAVGLRTRGLCRRARHAPGGSARTEAGLPQRLFDAPPSEAVARRGGARRDRHKTQPIDDTSATEFAVAFYQALTTGYSGDNRKIPGGCSIARAFAEAEAFCKAARGRRSRDLNATDPRPQGRRFRLGGGIPPGVRAHRALEPLRGRPPVRPARTALRHQQAAPRRTLSQSGVLQA